MKHSKTQQIIPILIGLLFWQFSTHMTAQECSFLPEDVPEILVANLSLAGANSLSVGRYLNTQSARSGRLSEDGSVLAYLSNASGSPQVWATYTENKWPRQLTFGAPITFFEWAPDGRLLYAVDRGGNERVGFYLISADGLYEEEILAPSDAFRAFGGFDKNMTQMAYATTERDGVSFDVHLFDLQSREDKRIFLGRMGLYVDSFSADGSYIMLSEASGEDAHSLFLLEVASGDITPLFLAEGDRSRFNNISWLEDGTGFYLITNFSTQYAGVAQYDISSKELRWLHTPERDIDQLTYSSGSSKLFWTENHGGYSELMQMDLSSMNISAVEGIPSGVYSIQAAKNQGQVAISLRSPQVPGDIWLLDANEDVHRLTSSAHGGLDLQKMILPEQVSFAARDGVSLYGLLYLPGSRTGDDLPFLINVHGGPTFQARPNFNATHQYLLSRGVGILDLNFRGSTGYGKDFARLNDGRLRENELYDLEDAANWLRGQTQFNVSRVGIAGGSYGGYLTMAALSRLPDVFDAGVAAVGVSNWITALEGASPLLKASDVLEYGDIDSEEDREFFEQISPLNYVHQVRAPLMLEHGANDPRDPPTESDYFACAVRAAGGEVEYLRFPNEGHNIRLRENQITFNARMADFLIRHLGER